MHHAERTGGCLLEHGSLLRGSAGPGRSCGLGVPTGCVGPGTTASEAACVELPACHSQRAQRLGPAGSWPRDSRAKGGPERPGASSAAGGELHPFAMKYSLTLRMGDRKKSGSQRSGSGANSGSSHSHSTVDSPWAAEEARASREAEGEAAVLARVTFSFSFFFFCRKVLFSPGSSYAKKKLYCKLSTQKICLTKNPM